MATAPTRSPQDQETPASTTDLTDPSTYTHEHPTPEEIAEEAYAIYVAAGRRDGSDVDDWLEAERRLRTRRR